MNSQKIKLFNFSILYDIVKWFVVRYLDKFTQKLINLDMETEDWTDGEINLKAEKSQDLNKEEGPEEEMFECMAITTIQYKL